MNTISFLLALHNHQPVGNFDHVIEDAYQTAYRPFLDVLERHPSIKVGIHNSGCLIDWLVARRPEYFDHLQRLVDRGQVEILTGGYYEPILPSIPERDREGQIRKLSTWIEKRFGQVPEGLWLTERVWEPSLVGSIARAGVRYTMVDDSHFLAAGLDPALLWGSWLTEDQAVPLSVFPISKELRYLIPFQPPERTIELLRRLADERPGRVAVLGDDGEKFGVWPHTHQLVYQEGWLDRFFGLLEENAEWLELRFPREALAAHPPVGKVYLPTASYIEMMEWALPAPEQKRYHELLSRVERNGAADAKFVRGGFWRNFFARYPESDHINKRMVQLRDRADALPAGKEEARDEARERIWTAQCNCAYWHGVFGGLYLPHLRDALYENLLAAESILDDASGRTAGWVDATRADFDCDGDREVFLRNRDLTLVFAPGEGGALQEIGWKAGRVALTNGLSRRYEAYHDKVAGAVLDGGRGDAKPEGHSEEGAVASIHDLVLTKEAGLERLLHYDAYRRACLIDHFLRSDADLDAFDRGEHGELGDFVTGAFEAATAGDGGDRVLSLRRTGTVWAGGEPRRVAVEKRVRLGGDGAVVDAAWHIENLDDAGFDVRFGVEWNFGLLAGNSPDHRYRIPGVAEADAALGSRGETEGVAGLALEDRWRGFAVELRFSRPALLWRLPVETVSLSEAGFERIYQSSCVMPIWSFRLDPGSPVTLDLTLAVRSLR